MTTTKTTRTLGDAEVFPIGLGGMPLSLEGRPDEDRAIRTIHAALDAGREPDRHRGRVRARRATTSATTSG